MKQFSFILVLLIGFTSISAAPQPDELDRVIIYLNGKLVGTWRAGEEQVVHIDKIAQGDTLIFKARTDIGGLGNSSIDIKDDGGITVDNIQSINSVEQSADYVYVVNLKKVDTIKVISLQVFLNVDPARNLPPPTIASISLTKK